MPAIEFPPGVTSLVSKVASRRNWQDANLVRWDDGVTLRPVEGWEKITFSGDPILSRIRKMHRWISTTGITYTAYLCEQHCYIDTGGSLLNITPVGGMAPLVGVEAGYGELAYSYDDYGDPRPGISTMQKFSPAWSLDNWGEDLLVMTSYDGRLLRWSPTTPATKLTAVTGAPINNRQFTITPEHHCMLFGMAGKVADFGWCSQENLNDWNFASITNTAGMYTIDPYAPITSAQTFSIGTMVFSPSMSYIVDYIGLPYIYRIRPIGRVPIPISAQSIAPTPEGFVWISIEGFWMYNGTVADVIPCPLWDSISVNMDFPRTVWESTVINMQNRGEIWWFWVDSKLDLVTSRYVALDYRTKVWMPGYLSRTCGITYGNERNPIMSDGTNIWKHETGLVYPNARFMPFLESQTLNAEGGDRFITVNKILPDIAGDRTALAFRLAMNNDRTKYATEKYSPQRAVNGHGWVDIRETARDVRLRIDMVKNSDWNTVGPIIFDIKRRGKKV